MVGLLMVNARRSLSMDPLLRFFILHTKQSKSSFNCNFTRFLKLFLFIHFFFCLFLILFNKCFFRAMCFYFDKNLYMTHTLHFTFHFLFSRLVYSPLNGTRSVDVDVFPSSHFRVYETHLMMTIMIIIFVFILCCSFGGGKCALNKFSH